MTSTRREPAAALAPGQTGGAHPLPSTLTGHDRSTLSRRCAEAVPAMRPSVSATTTGSTAAMRPARVMLPLTPRLDKTRD